MQFGTFVIAILINLLVVWTINVIDSKATKYYVLLIFLVAILRYRKEFFTSVGVILAVIRNAQTPRKPVQRNVPR